MNDIKFRLKNLHFIGIGGSGMSGIAEVLFNLGYIITGSDVAPSNNTRRLEKLGIAISYQHIRNNVANAQAVIVSSAIEATNIELITAQTNKIPIVPRAQMLAEIMRFRFGIAVSGTHGKTTTTSLITHIMLKAGLDPTYIIGGILNVDGAGNRLGKSNYLIAEADESDVSFLHLNPMLSVITNIDKDHMQNYDFDYQKLQQAFIDFSYNLPFYGLCIVCLDDKGIQAIVSKIGRQLITYGTNKNADIQAININYNKFGSEFTVKNYTTEFKIKLNLIGKHNILNALAAIAICQELTINNTIIANALAEFSGVARRLDFKGNLNINNHKIKLFDDYAHHPSEIKAVVSAIKKSLINKQLIVVFQPHRYSRTQQLFDEFTLELSKVQTLILLPIYSAGETEINNIDSSTLAHSIRSRANTTVLVAQDFNDCENIIVNVCQNNSIIMTLGAGNIVNLADKLVKKYKV